RSAGPSEGVRETTPRRRQDARKAFDDLFKFEPMSLLSEQDRQVVRDHLAGLRHQVALLFFTQTIGGPESAEIAKRVLDEVVGLNDKISLEEANVILERDRAAQYGITHIPAVAILRDGADTRMRFFGAPAGYEFMSLVDAIALAG